MFFKPIPKREINVCCYFAVPFSLVDAMPYSNGKHIQIVYFGEILASKKEDVKYVFFFQKVTYLWLEEGCQLISRDTDPPIVLHLSSEDFPTFLRQL